MLDTPADSKRRSVTHIANILSVQMVEVKRDDDTSFEVGDGSYKDETVAIHVLREASILRSPRAHQSIIRKI